LRDIHQESLDELKKIFDITGATERMECVERYSRTKAEEMGMDMEEYFRHTFEHCSDEHFNND
jgi:heterodisulfide reductase subunit C